MKEVLSQTHELAKVLTEEKTHGHLQKPSVPPKRPKTPENPPITPPSPENPDEEKSLKEQLSEVMKSIQLCNFQAKTDCSSGYLQVRTMSEGTNYILTYNDNAKRWYLKTENKYEKATEEEVPYIKLFLKTVTTKRLAEKPLLFALGWQIYQCLKSLAPDENTDELWEEYHKFAYKEIGV